MAVETPDLKNPPNFGFFFKLIDRRGILQHSRFSTPKEITGYSLDDNARALIVAVWSWFLYRDHRFLKSAGILLKFIQGQQTTQGDFHNYLFVSFKRRFLSRELAEDSFGETIWALGTVLAMDLPPSLKQSAREIWLLSFTQIQKFTSLRCQAYCLLGLVSFWKKYPRSEVKDLALSLANNLIRALKTETDGDWVWFEDGLVYANSLLPWALFETGRIFNLKKHSEAARKSFDFLLRITWVENCASPIGQRGWYKKGRARAFFDQQPIEAGYMVLTCLAAFEATKQAKYRRKAVDWFAWFFGANQAGLSLIDKDDGGCYDGLEPWKVNLNKGAESTVCYLMAYLELVRYGQGFLRAGG
ncbi:MAG: glycosyltransferase [Candidatus Pacebacteria bacterium]|nr:glycosyltransferase [Candidatus Paceibacterota bacterium]